MLGASREIAAAIGALAAYTSTVLPQVRRELRRWGPLPREKAKNAEAVAVFATFAPPRARGIVVRAIVALQVAIDLRDEVEEAGESQAGPEATARIDRLEAEWRREVAALPAHDAVLPHLERAIERCAQGQLHTHLAAEGGPSRSSAGRLRSTPRPTTAGGRSRPAPAPRSPPMH